MRTVGRLGLILLLVMVAAPIADRAAAATASPDPSGPAVATIVTLVDQLADIPAGQRPAAGAAAQNAVLAEVSGAEPAHVKHLRLANMVIADLTATQRQQLAADPRVAAIAVDAAIPVAPPLSAATHQPHVRPAASGVELPPVTVPAAACTGTQQAPQLEPEALGTLRARSDDRNVPTAASLGYDGAGVKIGIVSTLLDPNAPDFVRADGSHAVVDYQSFSSDGLDGSAEAAEAFGDVSSIVAQGRVTYDVAAVANPQAASLPGGHCWIRIVGVAPAADIVATDVEDAGNITVGAIVQAIDYSTTAGVDVLSESFSFTTVPDVSLRRAIQTANDAAAAAGVTIVASSGDAGGNSTIGNPATDPEVLAVGATINGRLWTQVGGLGIGRFGNGTWSNNTTSVVSSAGFTSGGRTIDVVAPGDAGWATCVAEPRYGGCTAVGDAGSPSNLLNFGGTSQAAPLVAGVAALIIQAYRAGHGGADPTPDQVRRLITGTSGDLGLPADQQGSGQADAYAAVTAARSLDKGAAATPSVSGAAGPTDGSAAGPAGGPLVADATQLQAVGTTTVHLHTRITNTGPSPVPMTDVNITQDAQVSRKIYPVALTGKEPSFTDGATNATMVATNQNVVIAGGASYARLILDSTATYPQVPVTPAELTAVAPDGTVASFGISTGISGIELWLPHPAAGNWKIVIAALQALPFTGKLAVDLGERRLLAVASPGTRTLAPGASTDINADVPLVADGDSAATLRVGHLLATPVILRRLLDLKSGSATATGVSRPGNGRLDNPEQTASWQFDVPADHLSLTAAVSLDPAAKGSLTAVLIDPTGLVRSISTNSDANGRLVDGNLQQSADRPMAGRWTVILMIWAEQLPSPTIDVPFQLRLSLDQIHPTAVGLPTGESLPAGSTRTVQLHITNPGPTALHVAVDPRLDTSATVSLRPLTNAATVAVPLQDQESTPMFQVPSFSTALTLTAESTVPTILTGAAPAGDPSLVGPTGTTSTITVGRADLAPGIWSTELSPPGPTVHPSPGGRATITAQVLTPAFDPDVTDAAGNAYVTAGGAPGKAETITIAPGSTTTVTTALHVSRSAGKEVSGFLALETGAQGSRPSNDLGEGVSTGDVLAVYPYRYTVGPASPTTTTNGPTPPVTTSSTRAAPTTPTAHPGPTAITTATVTPSATDDTMTSTSSPIVDTSAVTSTSTTAARWTAPTDAPSSQLAPTVPAPQDPQLAATGSDLAGPAQASAALLLLGVALMTLTGRHHRRARCGASSKRQDKS